MSCEGGVTCVILVMGVVVVVASVGPSLAAPPPHSSSSLSHQDSIAAIIINQMEMDKTIRESSASHGVELNQLRGEMNARVSEISNKVQGLNDKVDNRTKGLNDKAEEINNKVEGLGGLKGRVNEIYSKVEGLEGLNDKVDDINNKVVGLEGLNERVEGLNEKLQKEISVLSEALNNAMTVLNDTRDNTAREIQDVRNDIDEMNKKSETRVSELTSDLNQNVHDANENVEKWLRDMDAKRENENEMLLRKLQDVQNAYTVQNERPDPSVFQAQHNDSLYSMCSGTKVLYGAYGFLKSSNGNYTNNLDCGWDITLPAGTRPVFHWIWVNLEPCTSCCDYVQVYDVDHPGFLRICGNNPPDGNAFRINNNKFKVTFHTDGSVVGKGFRLQYRAVAMD